MTTPPRYTRLVTQGSIKTIKRFMGRNDDLADTSGSFTVIPTAEPWPHSVDSNGVAYPAGLVAVRFQYNPVFSPAVNNSEGYIVAVPDILPAGYTPSALREQFHLQTRNFHTLATPNVPAFALRPGYRYEPITKYIGPASVTDGTNMVRTDGALTPYYWMPENTGNFSEYANGLTPSLVAGWLQDSFGAQYPTAGFRYLRFRFYLGYRDNTQINPVASVRVRVRRNADSSTTGIGSIVIYELLLPATDHLLGLNQYDTGYIFSGGTYDFYAPTPGTRCNFYFEMKLIRDDSAEETPVVPYLEIWSGPRLDLPFPWTVTGDAGIVAPGGILAGTVPGY